MSIYFEWGLFVFALSSILITCIDHYFFYPKRLKVLQADPLFQDLPAKMRKERLRAPFLADYARSLWPVFLIVFFIRSFIFEPYVVPSGSLLPTIQLGDFVFANKLSYGLHLPLVGTVFFKTGQPKVGQIALFKDPVNPQVNFIKTVIAGPGDTISYVNKQLFINGKIVPKQYVQTLVEPNNANLPSPLVEEYISNIGGHIHHIYETPAVPAQNFEGLIVPPGRYFVMGDNRDNSDDSRAWGFVPEENFVGQARYIFLSYDSRTHHIRWNRIGMKLP